MAVDKYICMYYILLLKYRFRKIYKYMFSSMLYTFSLDF